MIARLVAAAALLAALAVGPAAAVEIQEIKTEGGLTAWLVEENAIPIVTISLSFRGGASADPADKAGRATLMAGLLEEGAGPYDDAGFAEAVETQAARFSFDASRDSVTVTATMLADQRDGSLELLRLALAEPRFDQPAVDRVKAQMISTIRQEQADPDTIATNTLFAAMFPNDPYGRSSNGTEETVAALTREDLRAATGDLMTRSNVTIGVVGAISAEELGPILDRLLGDLPAVGSAAASFATPAAPSGVEIVAFNSPQSAVMFAHPSLMRDDPDFLAAYVVNYVLGGGGFESRLMQEIREKKGLAYSAYSYLYPLDRAALHVGGVGTRNDAVAESIALVRQEWRRLAEQGFDAETLKAAKTYLTGAFALRFDSNAKIARYLVGAQEAELGLDYINQRNRMIEALTLAEVNRVAARILKPEELFFVVVGQPEGL